MVVLVYNSYHVSSSTHFRWTGGRWTRGSGWRYSNWTTIWKHNPVPILKSWCICEEDWICKLGICSTPTHTQTCSRSHTYFQRCTNTSTHAQTQSHMGTLTCTSSNRHILTHLHKDIQTHVYREKLHTHTHIQIHKHKHRHTHMLYIQVLKQIQKYKYKHVHIHKHRHKCTWSHWVNGVHAG